MREGIYVYCIMESSEPKDFGSIGMGNQHSKVYTVLHQGISAVVSRSPRMAFDSLPKEVLVGHLATHQFVIEQVMQGCTVIPVKFGTMVGSEKEVEEILKAGASQLKAALCENRHKIELEVVAMWGNLNSIIQEIGQDEEIQRFKAMAAREPIEQLQESQIALGKLVKAALDKKREKVAAELLEAIKPQAEDFRLHDLMNDTVILNVALLMDRDREKELDRTLNQLNEQYEEKIRFRCVGPLPPYSFSTVEVEKIGFSVVDQAREILELGPEATFTQIKEAHRRLTRLYHPDSNDHDPQAEEKYRRVALAYKVLTDYCQNYRYSFRQEEVKDQVMLRINQL